MDAKDKVETIRRYATRISELGPTVQSLGWRDEGQQKLRFSVLKDLADYQGKSVLDVGCGFGDFYGFLRDAGVDVNYTGIDISPDVLREARMRYPSMRFEQVDLLSDHFTEQFDIVVESGIFNHRMNDNEKFLRDMLEVMYNCCRIGVAGNMMTSYVDYCDEHLYYYNPTLIFTFAQTLSRYVTVRHDYPLYEFTLFVHRQSHFS